jgi:hypothetical protein
MVVYLLGTPVLWPSKLQPIVAMSTTEAEYIAAATAVKEGLWVRQLWGAMKGTVDPLRLMCDNQSVLTLIQQRTVGIQGRTKHVDTQYHFVHERYMRDEISVQYVATADQRADVMTKPLAGASFARARTGLGLMSMTAFHYLGSGSEH